MQEVVDHHFDEGMGNEIVKNKRVIGSMNGLD